MKKLKKGLSLLLVFAMIFSFASTAFAANTEWKDYSADTAIAKTDAYEAVQVMAGLGIIDGVSDNVLNPTGNFTRGQAAKIITYMLLGPEDASVLKADAKVFSDVETNEWFAPYVEFCKDAGIIDGYEDGTFHPYRTLTTDQWLKMLLTAIGFDAAEFGLTGKDWAINTAEVALRYDLITADEYALDFDREVAILYAYNALTFSFKTEKPLSETVFNLGETYTRTIYGDYTARNVTSKGEVIASFDVTSEDHSNAQYTVPTGYTVIKNGEEAAETKVGGKSVRVTVYPEQKTVVVVETKVDVLDDSTAAKKTLLNALDKVYDGTLKVGNVVTYNEGNESWLGKTAAVAYGNVEVLTPVAGYVSARNVKNDWISVGEGSTTEIYFNINANSAASALKTAETYNFYYDKYNNIAYVADYTPAAAPQTLIFLIATAAKGDLDFSDVWDVKNTVDAQAKYIDLTTGEIKTAEYKAVDGTPALTEVKEAAGEFGYVMNPYNEYYYATENEDGTISLNAYTTTNYAKVAKNDAKVTVGDTEYVADSETKLHVLTYTGAYEDIQVKVETGIQNFTTAEYTDSQTKTYTTVVVDRPVNTVPDDIYVITPAAAPEKTYVYGKYIGENTDYAVEGQGYDFVLSDGSTKTLYFDAIPDFDNENKSDGYTSTLTENSIYKLTIQNGSFTEAYELSPIGLKAQELKYADVSYISIGYLDNVLYFANDFGGHFLDSANKDVTLVVAGTHDENGRVLTGTSVKVYTDNDAADGKIVFVSVDAVSQIAANVPAAE
jgi:hypothetical protein